MQGRTQPRKSQSRERYKSKCNMAYVLCSEKRCCERRWPLPHGTVVKGDGPCLMGRDWLKHIRLNWKEIGVTMHVGQHACSHGSRHCVESIVNSDVFKDELGTMNAIRAELSASSHSLIDHAQFHLLLRKPSWTSCTDWSKGGS